MPKGIVRIAGESLIYWTGPKVWTPILGVEITDAESNWKPGPGSACWVCKEQVAPGNASRFVILDSPAGFVGKTERTKLAIHLGCRPGAVDRMNEARERRDVEDAALLPDEGEGDLE